MMEIALRDRNSALLTPGHDFSFALRAYEEAHAKPVSLSSSGASTTAGTAGSKSGSSTLSSSGSSSSSASAAGPKSAAVEKVGGGSSSSSSSSSSSRSSKNKPGSKDGRLPIIVVPSASSSLVTLLNVKRFLVDGEFRTGFEMKAEQLGSAKELKVRLTHGKTEFIVMDNPTRLKAEDWNRVVAVVVMGKEWQFKDWKWPTPVELFSKVLGLYLKWDNESVPSDTVAKWNVKTLDVSKNKRHLDPTSRIKFWQLLDEYIRVNKPEFHR